MTDWNRHTDVTVPQKAGKPGSGTAVCLVALVLSVVPVLCFARDEQGRVCIAQTSAEVLPALVNATAVGALSPDAASSYRLELRTNDYVTIAIEPQGIDVGARLVAPGGATLAELLNRRTGDRVLTTIAQSAGTHHLEIRPLETFSGSSCFVLTIRELHSAESRDRMRLRARRVFDEAEVLWTERGKAAASRVLEGYRRASDTWRIARDDSGRALASRRAGDVYHALGRPDDALTSLRASLRFARRVQHAEAEAAALNALARVCLDVGRMQEAMSHAQHGLELSRANDIASREAEALNVLGDIYAFSGRFSESLAVYEDAFDISRARGDRAGEAQALLNRGYSQADLGQSDDAQASYQAALSLWQVVGDRRGEAATRTALGHLYVVVGENERALGQYRQASTLAEPLGDSIGLARIQAGLGAVHLELGDPGAAIGYYRRSATLFRAAKYSNGEATALLWLGACLSSLGRHTQAVDELSKVLTLSRSLSDRRLEAQALEGLGRARLEAGAPRVALEHYRQSRALAGEIGERKWEIYSLNGIAMALQAVGETEQALGHLYQALRIAELLKSRFATSLTLFNLAKVESAADRADQAVIHIRRSLEFAETLRADIASLDLRASYVASVRDRRELEVSVLMRLNELLPDGKYDELAFEASERARARSFLDGLAQVRAGITEGVAPELLEHERSLRRALNAKAQQLANLQGHGGQAAETAALLREIEAITVSHREAEARIRAESPRYAALTQPKPLTLEEIQTLVVDEHSVLLQYFMGKDRSYVWAVTPDQIHGFTLPAREDIERRVRSYRVGLTAPAGAPLKAGGLSVGHLEDARALSRMLLGPVAAYLTRPRVLIVSDGILHLLPFSALPDPRTIPADTQVADPLAVAHELVYLPSASTLALLRRNWNPDSRWPKTARVFADPIFEADDPRIQVRKPLNGIRPGVPVRAEPVDSLRRALRDVGGFGVGIPRLLETRREARAIAALAPAIDTALDFDANRPGALSATLAEYRVIHFATHGIVDNEHPELSGIILSLFNDKGEPQDGFLRLHDIYNLKLPVDLVVLSACSTAAGKEVVGEGLIGLVRGFMYAGSRRVLASLWKVDDEATGELMTRFYRGMFEKGLTPPAALQAAQIELLTTRRWQHPFYWAGFVLQGEWK